MVAGTARAGALRLITLGGSITEIVYALGAEAQLVGTDSTSFYPPAAAKTPKVGYFRQLSAEGILSLRPDVTVGTDDIGPPAVIDQVRSAGVKVELVKVDHSWGEVQRKLQAGVAPAGARRRRANCRPGWMSSGAPCRRKWRLSRVPGRVCCSSWRICRHRAWPAPAPPPTP